MTTHRFDFMREPRDADLDSLLDLSLESCDEFLLVLTAMELELSGSIVLRELGPFLRECKKSTHYPGALMLEEDAVTVCHYDLTGEAVEILKRGARHLYAWQEPELPNDLCILRSGEPWLVTMASEDDAGLYLRDGEADEIRSRIPGLMMVEVEADEPTYHD